MNNLLEKNISSTDLAMINMIKNMNGSEFEKKALMTLFMIHKVLCISVWCMNILLAAIFFAIIFTRG